MVSFQIVAICDSSSFIVFTQLCSYQDLFYLRISQYHGELNNGQEFKYAFKVV